CSSSALASTFSTARSTSGLAPTTVAAASVPSGKATVTFVAPAMTWLLVTMWPWLSQTKPEPRPTPKPWPPGLLRPLPPVALPCTEVISTPDGSTLLYRPSYSTSRLVVTTPLGAVVGATVVPPGAGVAAALVLPGACVAGGCTVVCSATASWVTA